MAKTYTRDRVKRVFKKVMKDGISVSVAMKEEGYAEATANTPKNLTDGKGWNELLAKYIPDSKLTRVLDEGLGATKKQFRNNMTTGEIEEVAEEVDYSIRHKYLETGLKLKNKFPKEDSMIQINSPQVNILALLNKTYGESEGS